MRWAFAAATTLILAGCGSANPNDQWLGVVDTLPSGVVRVSNPAQGIWGNESGWRLVPELALGELDSPEALVFSSISSLAVGDDGRIYALDRASNELRIFSPEGEHLRTVGRSGGGPGEYRGANGLLWLASDTLVVIDQRGERYTILTGDGEIVRAVPRQLRFYGWVFSGSVIGDRLYERAFVASQTPVGDETDRRVAFIGTSLRADQELLAGRDTVLVPVPGFLPPGYFSVQTKNGGGMSMTIPFTTGPMYHLDPHGSIWLGNGREFRLTRTSMAGDTIMDLVLDAEPTAVTQEDLAEWEKDPGVQRFLEMGGDLDRSRIPAVKPFFEMVYVDPDGNLWASVPSGPEETAFAVFDSAGRYLGRLEANGFKRNVYIPPVVRNDRLYVVGSDNLDVPKVYVFRIVR